MTLRHVLWVALALGAAACRSPPDIDVEEQWGDAMRSLAMFAFYPMTEDVQIGDLYLHAPPTDPSRRSLARFSLLRIASLPRDAAWLRKAAQRDARQDPAGPRIRRGTYGVFEELLWQQTEDRLRIRASPGPGAKPSDASAGNPPARNNDPADPDRFEVGRADDRHAGVRLSRTAIPALTVGRISEAQLGSAGALGNVGAHLGLGTSSRTAIRISLRDVQEIGLDAWRISRQLRLHEAHLLIRARAEDLLLYLSQLRPDLLQAACNGDGATLDREGVAIFVINRVIYAGGIEYSFGSNAETAVRLALDLQNTLPGRTRARRPPTSPAVGGSSNAASPDEASTAAGERLATAMSAAVGDLNPAGGAGLTATFGIGTFGALALKTDFDRPIAVGAGSRVGFSFSQALRGDYDTSAAQGDILARRFGYARDFCRTNVDGFSPAGLEKVFGIPAGAASPASRAPQPGDGAGHAIRINRAGGIFDAP